MQTKLIPLFLYMVCNLLRIFSTLTFFEIFDSMVSISRGSAAANKIASTSLSPSLTDDGNLTILSFFYFFIYFVICIYHQINYFV